MKVKFGLLIATLLVSFASDYASAEDAVVTLPGDGYGGATTTEAAAPTEPCSEQPPETQPADVSTPCDEQPPETQPADVSTPCDEQPPETQPADVTTPCDEQPPETQPADVSTPCDEQPPETQPADVSSPCDEQPPETQPADVSTPCDEQPPETQPADVSTPCDEQPPETQPADVSTPCDEQPPETQPADVTTTTPCTQDLPEETHTPAYGSAPPGEPGDDDDLPYCDEVDAGYGTPAAADANGAGNSTTSTISTDPTDFGSSDLGASSDGNFATRYSMSSALTVLAASAAFLLA